MMDERPTVVIIGADSVVGKSLVEQLPDYGWRVLGTTRRNNTVALNRVFLDLSGDVAAWNCPHSVTAAVVCAAVTKGDAFSRNAELAARVNLIGIPALVEKLIAQGIFTVFLSSNAVFDGACPFAAPGASLAPLTEYGRHKVAVEEQVLAAGRLGSVVRLTKVLEPGFPLLQSWLESLRRGKPIHPFADMPLAPVPLWFVVQVLERVLAAQASGIVQVSAPEDVTYAQVARYLARRIGASEELVLSVRSSEARPYLSVPVHTTLDTTRLAQEFGLCAPNVWSAIDSAVGLDAVKAA